MVLYVCFRCNYNTTHKNSFKNHLNRKFICNPILEDISIESIKLFYGFIKNENTNNDELQNHSKILQITPNHSNPFTPNNSIFTPNNSIFTPNNSKIDQSENHEAEPKGPKIDRHADLGCGSRLSQAWAGNSVRL